MQNRTGNSDDEDDPQFLFFGGTGGGGLDEDKITNVYDEKFDQYIDMPPDELGLTTEVEPNLGYHPYNTNYLYISNMNIKYVKKNLKEAQKFLSDEECYAFRNIFDRSYFLLSEPLNPSNNTASAGGGGGNHNESSSKSFTFAKNDNNLKMTRLIFRYRNNLDELFPWR
jgi:hypothetical protein